MKIAFVCTLYAPNEIGGAERAMRLVAEAAVARGHQSIVISLSPEGRYSQSSINGVTVYYVPLANVNWPHAPASERPPWKRLLWHMIDAYNPVMGSRVRKILAAERPDVVETNNLQGFSVAVWRAARSLGIPVVQVLHDYYLGCPNSTMTKAGRSCAVQCKACMVFCTPRRLLSNVPSTVSSVSARTLQRLQECGMFAQVPSKEVVATAFDAEHLQQPRADRPPGTALTIGYMGRLEQIKGIELLLDAMRSLTAEEVTLLVAGSGDPGYIEAVKRSGALPNVKFLGFTRPEEFFPRIDVLIVPSIWEEPLGRVIFEGYSYGVPVIVTRRGGMPEIVEQGVTGFVVEPELPSALADLLAKLVRQGLPARRFSIACYARSKQFGIEGVFKAHLSNWQGAIARTSRRAGYAGTSADRQKVT